MLLPLMGSPLADPPSARAHAVLGRLARFTLADWARAWRRFEDAAVVACVVARRALAEALPRLGDDGLVTRTRDAAVAIRDRLPVTAAASWTPGGPRDVTVHAAFAALCRPLLPRSAYEALAGPPRAVGTPIPTLRCGRHTDRARGSSE